MIKYENKPIAFILNVDENVPWLKQFRLIYKTKLGKLHIVREPTPFGKVLVVDDLDMNFI